MKLLCTVSKILMCWKLCHETSIENGLTNLEIQKYIFKVRELTRHTLPCFEGISLLFFFKEKSALLIAQNHNYNL